MSGGEEYVRRADELVCGLEEHFRRYTVSCERQREAGGVGDNFLRMFRHWISYNAKRVEPMHADFLEELQKQVNALSAALTELEEIDPRACRRLAARAVSLLMAPQPEGVKSDCQWYLLVAEYQCGPLFSHLSREDLEYWRDEMLRRTPRRMMYPKQLELLQTAEKLLEQK